MELGGVGVLWGWYCGVGTVAWVLSWGWLLGWDFYVEP